MPIMPDFEAEIRRDLGRVFHHHSAPQQTPAPGPVNLAATPVAAATTQEEPMSIITDAEDLYAGAKSELAKFEQALHGALAKAKAFEASPFAQLAEKTAASVLPPEAVAIAVSTADKVLDDLIGLYTPAQDATAPSAPAQPAVPAQQ